MRGPGRLGSVAAWGALVVGVAYAAVSAYWALGGSSLTDTVGGAIEHWGRRRTDLVVAGLWAVTVAKLAAAVLPLAVRAGGEFFRRRVIRVFAWAAAVVLTGYGLVLTVSGVAVLAGLVPVGPAADRRALTWHTALWDPWFLLWGLLSILALHLQRSRHDS